MKEAARSKANVALLLRYHMGQLTFLQQTMPMLSQTECSHHDQNSNMYLLATVGVLFTSECFVYVA